MSKKQQQNTMEPKALRPKEITRIYGIGHGTIWNMFKEGLPSIKVTGLQGRRGTRIVMIADLEKWLADRKETFDETK